VADADLHALPALLGADDPAIYTLHRPQGASPYLLLADHAIEIVADRGLHGRVSPAQWQRVCTHLREGLRGSHPVEALQDAIDEVSSLIEGHFPASTRSNDDALPNSPQLLG